VQDERRRRSHRIDPLETADAATFHTPETERNRAELGQALAGAVGELSGEHRDVFVLAEFHGLDMKDIGRVLAIPEATAKTRLFRARERLRVLLKHVWEDA
jgi:RNA polymerase sigma-70 factor (ECF subfamily)